MPKTAARNRIAEEHAALSAMLESIQRIEAPGRLAVELEKLQTLLRAHFASEEAADGFHAAMDRSAPHLLPAVQHLFADHRRFLGDLEELIATAHALSTGPWADLVGGVADLATRLHAHEEEENALFIESVYTDLGGGD